MLIAYFRSELSLDRSSPWVGQMTGEWNNGYTRSCGKERIDRGQPVVDKAALSAYVLC